MRRHLRDAERCRREANEAGNRDGALVRAGMQIEAAIEGAELAMFHVTEQEQS